MPRYAMMGNKGRGRYRSPLQVATEAMELATAVRKFKEPTQADLAMRREAVGWVKYNIDQYSKIITDPNTSPASRNHMKQMLKDFAMGLPPGMREGIKPVLAHSPINPITEGLENFERLNPQPRQPYAFKEVDGVWREERDQTNRLAFADYDWKMTEWRTRREMFKNKLLGMGENVPGLKMPKLLPTDDPNVFSFKDHVTGSIGTIDLAKVPKGEITKAVDEFGDTWPDIMHNGFYRTSEPARVQVGDMWREITVVRDLIKGNKYIESVDLGPTAGSLGGKKGGIGKLPDDDLLNGVAAANLGEKPKVGKNPQQAEIITRLREIKDADWSGEAQTLLKEFNEEMVTRHGHIVVPHNGDIQKSWWRWLPGANLMKMEGASWMVLPVDRAGLVQFMDKNGKVGDFFYNSEAEMAVDAEGNLVESTKGVEPGGVVNDVFDTAAPKGGVVEEAQSRKMKVGDILVRAYENMARKEKIGGTKKAEELVDRMSRKYANTEVPGVKFWQDLKVIAREVKIADQFLGDWMEEMFVRTPRRAIDAFLEMEIEVEEENK